MSAEQNALAELNERIGGLPLSKVVVYASVLFYDRSLQILPSILERPYPNIMQQQSSSDREPENPSSQYEQVMAGKSASAQDLDLEHRLNGLPQEILDEILNRLLELHLVPGRIHLGPSGHFRRSKGQQHKKAAHNAGLRRPNVAIMFGLNKYWLKRAKNLLYFSNVWVMPDDVQVELFNHWNPTDLQQLSVELNPCWRLFHWCYPNDVDIEYRFYVFWPKSLLTVPFCSQRFYSLWAYKRLAVNDLVPNELLQDTVYDEEICQLKQMTKFKCKSSAPRRLTTRPTEPPLIILGDEAKEIFQLLIDIQMETALEKGLTQTH